MRDHLVARLPRLPPARLDAMLREGRIVGRAAPSGRTTPFRPREFLWFHRDLPVEVPVPFAVDVLHRDDDVLVVDKPHFLATIPRGRHVVETALVRLRRELDLPELSPAHRLDRVTAGVLLFVVRRDRRGAYQTLFRDRRVRKTYEAVAPYDPAPDVPADGAQQDRQGARGDPRPEVPGPPNAETHVELLEHRGGLARYRLTPLTGRTHQLRLHLRGLGLPILGDRFYGTASGRLPERHRARRLDPPAAAARGHPGVPRPGDRRPRGGSPAAAPCRRGPTRPAGPPARRDTRQREQGARVRQAGTAAATSRRSGSAGQRELEGVAARPVDVGAVLHARARSRPRPCGSSSASGPRAGRRAGAPRSRWPPSPPPPGSRSAAPGRRSAGSRRARAAPGRPPCSATTSTGTALCMIASGSSPA